MNGLSADDFSESREYSGVFAEVPAENFSRFIPRVIHAAGQKGSRYALNGAKLEISNERIRMVATDGHRLALVEREGNFSESVDVLLPKKTVIEFARLCACSDEMLRINDLINPARLRLGIKRAFTGEINEVLSEIFQNASRAGARNVRITIDDRGFTGAPKAHKQHW